MSISKLNIPIDPMIKADDEDSMSAFFSRLENSNWPISIEPREVSFESLINAGNFEEIERRIGNNHSIEILSSRPKDRHEEVSRHWICFIAGLVTLDFYVHYSIGKRMQLFQSMGTIGKDETIGQISVGSMNTGLSFAQSISTKNYNGFIQLVENHTKETISDLTYGNIDYLDLNVISLNFS